MTTTRTTSLSILLAGLLAVAGVQAQTALPGGSSDGPPAAGEASNQTNGQPNAKTTNSPVSEAPMLSREQVRADAQNRDGASATALTAPRAGEASTMVQGNPNMDPANPLLNKSRSELRTEADMRRAQVNVDRSNRAMGNTGYGTPVGTPASAAPNTPSVFQGGTPQ